MQEDVSNKTLLVLLLLALLVTTLFLLQVLSSETTFFSHSETEATVALVIQEPVFDTPPQRMQDTR